MEKSDTPDELLILICKKLKEEGQEHNYSMIYLGHEICSTRGTLGDYGILKVIRDTVLSPPLLTSHCIV